jgi:hypothetical protein
VIVALGGAEPASALLQAAGDLLRGTQAELAGLFVEDLELLRLAALPFTREIGLASGTVRPLDVPDVERAFKRQAEQVRRLLVQTAAALELPWSFQVARGSLLDEVLAAATLADFTIVGERQPAVERSTGASQSARRTAGGALFDIRTKRRFASGAALQLRRPWRTVSCSFPGNWGRRRTPAAPRRERLRVAPPSGGRALPTLLRRRRRALVLPRGELRAARDEIQALLQTVECPVVLVR